MNIAILLVPKKWTCYDRFGVDPGKCLMMLRKPTFVRETNL